MYLKHLLARGPARAAAHPACSIHGPFGGTALVIANAEGIVMRRVGPLACWTPAPGSSLFDCPVLFGLHSHIGASLRHGRRELIADIRVGPQLPDPPLDLIFDLIATGFIRPDDQGRLRASPADGREPSARTLARITAETDPRYA